LYIDFIWLGNGKNRTFIYRDQWLAYVMTTLVSPDIPQVCDGG